MIGVVSRHLQMKTSPSFPYGTLERSLADGFFPPECWPEYGHFADIEPFFNKERVGKNGEGLRWSFWPLTFEEYVGDEEPYISLGKEGALAYNRVVQWKRVRSEKVAHGWKTLSNTWRIDGYFPIQELPDYLAHWKKNARRDLALWKKVEQDGTYAIEEIPLEEYSRAYTGSQVAGRIGRGRLTELQRKLTLPEVSANTTLWGVRNTVSQKLVGGVALIHSPTFRSSTHAAPFMTKEGVGVFASTALMDKWFSEAQRRQDKFLITMTFWYPGQPKRWKGFSEFKSHFGWRYVAYPPILMRFVRGKFW